MSDRIPASLARLVRKRARDACEYCRLPQSSQEATFHVDHIRPSAADGATTVENLALACVTCSLRKAARTEARDPQA
jgi:5-methylcytosine-specific restriction endonuclease McrA